MLFVKMGLPIFGVPTACCDRFCQYFLLMKRACSGSVFRYGKLYTGIFFVHPDSQEPTSEGLPPYQPKYWLKPIRSVIKFRSPLWLLAATVRRVGSSAFACVFSSFTYSKGLSPSSFNSLKMPPKIGLKDDYIAAQSSRQVVVSHSHESAWYSRNLCRDNRQVPQMEFHSRQLCPLCRKVQ